MIPFWEAVVNEGIFRNPNLIIPGDLNFTLLATDIWGQSALPDPLCSYFVQLLTCMKMVDVAPTCIGPTWKNGRSGV